MAVFVTVATTDNDVFDAERGRALLHRRPFAAFGFIGARRAGEPPPRHVEKHSERLCGVVRSQVLLRRDLGSLLIR